MVKRKVKRRKAQVQVGGNIFQDGWKIVKRGARAVNKAAKKSGVLTKGLKMFLDEVPVLKSYSGQISRDIRKKTGYGKKQGGGRKRKAVLKF